MSRLTLFTSALAAIALGAGAIGFAQATGLGVQAVKQAHQPGTASLQSAAQPARQADRTIQVDRQEGVAAALRRAGVGGLDSALAQQAAGSVYGPAELWLGAPVGFGARSLERMTVRLGIGRKLVIERKGDVFARRAMNEAADSTPVRLRISGGPGLAAELVEAGLPRRTRDDIIDRLGSGTATSIDLIVAHEATTLDARYGVPLYLGVTFADGSIQRWLGEGETLHPVGGVEADAATLLRPLPGRITSDPGLRFHPILRFLRWHHGTDFASPLGTPIQAALGGRVVEAGWHGGYGQAIRLSHADGSTTLYAHLSELDVRFGQAVTRGAIIGKVGATGLATGPHLHFEWKREGVTLHPDFRVGEPLSTWAPSARQAQIRSLLSAPYRLPPDRRS